MPGEIKLTERRLTLIAVVNHFGHWFAIGLVVPVLAIFQIDRGLSLTQVGFNGLVYALTVVVLELPTGGLSDSLGRRAVYLVSLVFSILAASALTFAYSPTVLAVGFVLFGAARALSSGSMDAYFVDAFGALPRKGELQRFLGRVGVFVPISLAIGGFLGGMIPIWADSLLQIDGRFDRYSVLFLGVLTVTLLQLTSTLVLVERDEPAHSIQKGHHAFSGVSAIFRDSVRLGLANRRVFMLLLGSAAWGIAFAGLEQFWQPFVDSVTATDSPTDIFGYLTMGYFAVASLGAVAANWIFGAIGPRYGSVVGVSRIVIGALFIGLSLTAGVAGFAVVYLGLFMLNGVNDSPEQALFNSSIPASARSTLLSFQSLFMQLGGGIAAVVWGVLSERYSIGFSWRIAGVIFALSGILYFVVGDGAAPKTETA